MYSLQGLHPLHSFLEIGGVAGVGQAQNDFGLFNFLLGAFDTECFDCFGGLANASGVDEAKLNTFDIEYFFDDVAGGAGNVGNNGAFFAEELIEKGAFAGIGRPHNGNWHALLDGVTEFERGGQTAYHLQNRRHQLLERAAVGELNIFFGEVEL